MFVTCLTLLHFSFNPCNIDYCKDANGHLITQLAEGSDLKNCRDGPSF